MWNTGFSVNGNEGVMSLTEENVGYNFEYLTACAMSYKPKNGKVAISIVDPDISDAEMISSNWKEA